MSRHAAATAAALDVVAADTVTAAALGVVAKIAAVIVGLALAALVLAACPEPAPTREFAEAKASYDAAMAQDPGGTYVGPLWDDVVKKLRAVPSTNRREQRTAALLADDIEGTRKKIDAQLKTSTAAADKLLDLPSLPPLDPSRPVTPTSSTTSQSKASSPSAAAASGSSPSKAGASSSSSGAGAVTNGLTPTATTTPATIACHNACVEGLRQCALAKGCAQTPADPSGASSLHCEGDAALKLGECQKSANECEKDCGT